MKIISYNECNKKLFYTLIKKFLNLLNKILPALFISYVYFVLSSREGVNSISLSGTLSSSCYLKRGLVDGSKYFDFSSNL